ncbi:MAG: hypothetical protein SOT58_11425 [Agathobacter sp.]|nr:hypothetical protein [Lachnobacterium sp.]MDY2912639.1 hypothetical protein [Agathobacter sp.]
MRLKYYLRGLGLGIIFTCLMFMLFSNKKADNTDQMDINQQLETTTETLSNQTSGDDKNDTANDEAVSGSADVQNNTDAEDDVNAQNNADAQNTADNQTGASDTTDTSNQTDDSNITGETSTDDVQDEYVTLVIEKGDIARDVAESLYEDGIIDDAESFRKYLGETGVSRTLHAGEYNIKVGSTYEEIVELLK